MSGTTRVFACQSSESKQSEQSGAHSKRSDLDTLLELGAYHYPLDLNTADVQNHGTNTIRALADMFTCKLSSFPITVGIFTSHYDKEYLSRLAAELRNISRLSGPLALRFNVLLFLFPLVVSTFLGYAVGMLTTWQVGLSIGHVGMFLQITFLVIIITGSRVCHNHVATRISQSVAEFLRWLQLVLNVCFCYPTRSLDAKAPVKTIVVYHRLWPSTTPNVALFSMVDKMWTGLIRMHGEIPIRLQRASKPSPLPNRRFKRVCCLPAFLVVLAFCVAFMVETGMIRYHSGQIATMLSHSGMIAVFVISSSILFLGLFGSIPSLYRLVRSLTVNPVQPLRAALADFLSYEANEEEYQNLKPNGKYKCLSRTSSKPNEPVILGNSTSLKNLAITAEEERARRADILIKEEFAKLCKLSVTFDRFLSQQQTRFIICLDASETKQSDVLAKLIYQIHSLVLTESTAPVAFVLEASFKVLLGDTVAGAICPPYIGPLAGGIPASAPRTLSDNLHLVHTSIHLPIYLEAPVFTDVECEPTSKDFTPNSVSVSPNGFSRPSSTQMAKRNSGIMYTPRSIFGNRGSVAPLRPGHENNPNQPMTSQQLSLSRSNSTASKSMETCQGIAHLFLRDHELADWNGKLMKQLVSTTSFTSRFLRLCNLEVPIDEIILWISMVQYWPYHVAWLVVYLEGLVEGKLTSTGKSVSNQTGVNLIECFREVKSRVAASINQLEPLVTDDRNLDRLEAYLRAKACKPISLGSLKKLISCVLTHNPFLRYCIRAQILNPDRHGALDDRRAGHSGPFAPALTTLMEEQTNPFRRSTQNISSSELYSMSRSNSGKGRMTQMGSIDNRGGQFFASSAELLTSAEETPKLSTQARIKKPVQPLHLSQYTVADVCNLVANITEIEPEHRHIYQTNICERNINGLVLCRTDPEHVKHEIGMNQSDWQAFYQSVLLLREQESVLRGQSGAARAMAEVESDSGSIISPLVITNKHPCVGSPPSLTRTVSGQSGSHGPSAQTRLTRSSPSSSLTSFNHRMKNTTLVRQTPWLLSPQVPTTVLNSDGVEMQTNDIVFPTVYNSETAENQASLSGMEEPESLWKPTTHPMNSKAVLKTRSVGESQVARNLDRPSTMKSSHEQIEMEVRKEVFASPRSNMEPNMNISKHSRRSSNLEHERAVACHKEENVINPVVPHRIRASRLARSESRRYNSRSTVDLRTAFGPLTYNPQAAELCYRQVLHRKSKGQGKAPHVRHMVANHDPRVLFTQASRNEADLFNMHLLGYEQQQQQPRHPEVPFGAVPVPHRSPWKSAAEQPEEEMKDLRRMKKRPCRRSSKSNQMSYDVFVNKNAQGMDLMLPTPSSRAALLGGHPDSGLLDSESDSVIYNPALITPFPGVVPWPGSRLTRRERRARRLHHSPALNPAQLASLYSYVSQAGKFPTFPNTPFEFPYGHNVDESQLNSSKMSYFQFPSANYVPHCAEPLESYKPSQKKRPRHMEQIPTAVTSPQTLQAIFKTGNSNELVNVDYLDEGTNSPDSEGEECTCEYWYGIDRNGGKVTISEPTLRGDSDDLYSDENMQTYSFEHDLHKQSSHGKTNGDFGPDNDSP